VVVADSGVWIDFFNATPNPARDELRRMLQEGAVRIVVPDLVLFEVLRGFRHERDLRQAQTLMSSLSVEAACSPELALQAMHHYRSLRATGLSPRSSIDVLVAAFCIEKNYLLLHRDRDFTAFETHRGLRGWRH
jgi:predicted nucleic acid-binding protein